MFLNRVSLILRNPDRSMCDVLLLGSFLSTILTKGQGNFVDDVDIGGGGFGSDLFFVD